MSVTASRTLQLQFSGDVTIAVIQSALDNLVSPGEPVIQTLAIGDNTITPPNVSGVVTTSLSILPPAGNTTLMKLKQIGTDSGIPLHKTDWSSISLDTTFVSLVLNAAAQINGVRLIWS